MKDLDRLYKLYKRNFATTDPKVSPVKLGLLSVYDEGWTDGYNRAIEIGAQLETSRKRSSLGPTDD